MQSLHIPSFESAVIGESLRCIAEGKLVAHDWEFQTLFGIEPHQVQLVARAWPEVEIGSEVVDLAVNNSLNTLANLVSPQQLGQHLPYTREELARVLAFWRSAQPSAAAGHG